MRFTDFCSHSCSAKSSNSKRVRKVYDFTCACCKQHFLGRKGRKYCDDCSKNKDYRKTQDVNDAKTDRVRRQILIRKYGHACQVESCRHSTWNGLPIPLELDHIDGKSNNNVESNLRVICPNCHAQTPNYKGKNMGNGTRKFIITQRF